MMNHKEVITADWQHQVQQKNFTWASFQFVLKASEQLYLPPYKGSTLRGGFGHSFRRVCCTVRNQECHTCLLNQSCPYAYVFETPKTGNVITIEHQATNLPHPFIIEPPLTGQTEFQPGEELTFDLVLIGKSISFLPYFVYTFDQLGRMGLGKGRGKAELTSVYATEDVMIEKKILVYDSNSQVLNGNFKIFKLEDLFNSEQSTDCDRIGIKFLTPTRILQNNRLISRLPFELLIRNLMRRISLVGRIHCESSWELPFRDIIDQAENEVELVESKLNWEDWERYSSRQNTRMKMGGVVGRTVYKGNLKPFLPLIFLGEIIHVGKSTTFGLGKYVVERNNT